MYVSFSVQTATISEYYSVFPLITMDACNSTNMFAIKGGLIYAQKGNVSLSHIRSKINNPTDPELHFNIRSFLETLHAVGEYISIEKSFLEADSLYLTGHSIDINKSRDTSSIVLFSVISSTATITNSLFTGNEFSNSGLLVVSESTLNLIASNFTHSNYVS